MSEFRYNRLIAELLDLAADRGGAMEIHLASLVPNIEARRSLMQKVNTLLQKPFDPTASYDVAYIVDLARFFARTFYNRSEEHADGQ